MSIALILITGVSLTVALIASAVAWSVATRERRRSDARVSALAGEIGDIPLYEPARVVESVPRSLQQVDLFATHSMIDEHRRLPFAIAAGAAVVVTVIATAIGVSAVSRNSVAAGVATHAAASAPLELVELRHERRADRLELDGAVVNPPNGEELTRLTAVVLLFNQAGQLLASERAPVDARELMPGLTAHFSLNVPAADVARYRVSFMRDDEVVPHLDKRHGA